MDPLSPELTAMVWAAALTGVLWIPIILNRLAENGMWTALRNPQPDVRPVAGWAYRLTHAHRNAIENLVVFAPLALAVDAQGAGDALTATAGAVFVASRLAHAVIYAFGIPVLRTLAFTVGFLVQAVFLLRLLGMV